jgi:hypothetical protein
MRSSQFGIEQIHRVYYCIHKIVSVLSVDCSVWIGILFSSSIASSIPDLPKELLIAEGLNTEYKINHVLSNQDSTFAPRHGGHSGNCRSPYSVRGNAPANGHSSKTK